MKCITCKKKIIVDKETKQPYGAVSVIALPTPSSKHGSIKKKISVNAPQQWVSVHTTPRYGFICDDCFNPKYAQDWNNFSDKI